jgi:hypothetical protein
VPVKTASSGAAGCLSLVAFCLSPVVGSTLAMPATALYVHRHHPAQLDRSDHWLLFACLAPPLAVLIALWSARHRGRPALTVTVRTVTLLVASFAVTLWTLEHYAVPVELLTLVPILTGWAGILLFLVLIPLLNLLFPAHRRDQVVWGPSRPASRRTPRSRPSRSSSGGSSRSSSGGSSGGRGSSGGGGGRRQRPRRTESPRRDGQPEYRARSGKPDSRARDGKPEYRSRDGRPEHRSGRPASRPGDGTPRYRDESTDRPGQPNRPRQGDGTPRYRADPPSPPPPRRPSGDGKPVYRDD